MTSCDLSSLSPYFRDLSTVTVSLKVIYVFSIAQFREDELDHVSEWVQRNNLKLNRTKSVEIVFEDRWRKSLAQYSPTLLDIQRATQIKILGITVTDHLSISEHVRDVICKCGQSLHAIKVLHSHGMCVDALKEIYRAVLLAKLLHASPAWWGFATTSDKQLIEAFVHRGVRLGMYGSSDPTLAEDADERLFRSIKYSEHHVPQQFLPEHNSHSYSLRPRRHNFILTTKTDERNSVTRKSFANIYRTLALLL